MSARHGLSVVGARLATVVQHHDDERGYRRVTVDPETFTLPWLAWWPGRVYRSMDMVTVPERRLRFVSSTAPLHPFTPGELARTWLKQTAADHQRRTLAPTLTDQDGMLKIPPALYFTPTHGRDGEWVMLDVRACYWTLYSRLPLDSVFRFRPGRAPLFARGTVTISDRDRRQVGADKLIRNAAWGILRSSGIRWFLNGKAQQAQAPNRLGTPMVVGAVMAAVHAAAREAIDAGAVCWLTDAAICRPDRVDAIRDLLRDRWGLDAVVKASGAGRLYGCGDYRIGPVETMGEHRDRRGYSSLLRLTSVERDTLARVVST